MSIFFPCLRKHFWFQVSIHYSYMRFEFHINKMNIAWKETAKTCNNFFLHKLQFFGYSWIYKHYWIVLVMERTKIFQWYRKLFLSYTKLRKPLYEFAMCS